jgi:membrane protein DedA with SNARE-associated domain
VLDTLLSDFMDLRLWLFVLFVTAIGLIEKLAIYRAGQQAAGADLTNMPGVNQERRARLETLFEVRGSYILLLASIPGIGAVMAAVAGDVGVGAATFTILVAISILVRNWLIVILSGQLAALF